MSSGRKALEAALGHSFADGALLDVALTHPSALKRGRGDKRPDYERMEFLGDRVLGVVIADRLYHDYTKADAGDLAKRFNELVRRETLAEIAGEIGLGDHIRMSDAERETGGAEKPAILADICEAVIAALFLDGGLEAARAFIHRHWQARLAGQVKVPQDPKMALQEWAHAQGIEPPVYSIVSRSGPDHAPIFVIRASLKLGEAEASGTSKKVGERKAAAVLLKELAGHD